MKLLVFSDSHRSLSGMLSAIELHRPDTVIHLGDLQDDAEEVGYVYPQLPLISVPGNCDGWTTSIPTRLVRFDQVSILLSHGHLWGVKGGYHRAILEAHKADANILLFGHTHQAYCEQMDDGLWVLNPGASRKSYGIIELDHNNISCTLHYHK